MELRTDKIRACFDRKIGNFTELWNLSTNTNYVRCAPRDPLIELYGLKNGERVKLSGHISDEAEAPDALVLSYDSFGEYDISAKVHLPLRAGSAGVFCRNLQSQHNRCDRDSDADLGGHLSGQPDRKIISFTRTTQVTKQKIRYIITLRIV